MNSLYPYCNRDLLDEGEFYMYSEYQGSAFLSAYLKKRSEVETYLNEAHRADIGRDSHWLSDWRELITQTNELFEPDVRQLHHDCHFTDSPVSIGKVSPFSTRAKIDTTKLLRAITQDILQGHWQNEDELYRLLSQLLRRFEVFKKLHDEFTPRFRKASDQFRTPINYALLSVSCLFFYEHTGNLKFLNGALKLNDLLGSIVPELDRPEARLMTLIAIRKEKIMVRTLINQKHIEL
jgi:hypothetical protein